MIRSSIEPNMPPEALLSDLVGGRGAGFGVGRSALEGTLLGISLRRAEALEPGMQLMCLGDWGGVASGEAATSLLSVLVRL